MSVSKWRVFICPCERVSVIHRFSKKGEPEGEMPASFSPSINQRLSNQSKPFLPQAGRFATCKTFHFHCLVGPLFIGEEAEGCTGGVTRPTPHASQPVGGRVSTGTTGVLVI